MYNNIKGLKVRIIMLLFKMKTLSIILLVFNLCRAFASIFPDNDEASWHRRIDEKIDKNRKSDVVLRLKIDPSKICK